ncbi:hypothetical protein BGX23_011425 [Mortierella sp. AD031]|nr:hypothetical protein BGX23_011425 [Mortierella sp. AD031]
MDSLDVPIHVIIRLPYPRPEGFVDSQPNQLQDLHRLGEQQDMSAQLQTHSRPASRATIGPGTMTSSLEANFLPLSTLPGIRQVAESPITESHRADERESSFAAGRREDNFSGVTSSNSSSNIHQGQEANVKAQASPSLSTSISTFPSSAKPASMSSSASTIRPSNSASQIFEETSFFNQLSSNDSLSRGQQQQQQRADQLNREEMAARGEYQSSSLFGQSQGRYDLGFIGGNPSSSLIYRQTDHGNHDDDDLDDGDHTDKDDDGSSQDESGPLREQIKQLQLEDVLAFLPVGGASASGMLQRPADDGYQSRTASGDKMPFQLDDELANLGTKSLEEILGHDGGDEDDGDRVKDIRFKDAMAPNRLRGIGRDGDSKAKISPERSGPNSQKSSAHNSVGSSFSDLSDSSVTQSAMEDAYLSGYNNSKISLFMHASTRN